MLSASLSDKITIQKKPKKQIFRKDNSSISGMSGHGESVSIVTPDKKLINCRNKINKTSETLIKGK